MEARLSKSKNNCCVPQCSATYKNRISLHSFPKDTLQCKKWIVALKIGKKVSPYMKVCSLHFKDEDFFLKDHVNCLARLKRNVIPTRNLPVGSHDRIVHPSELSQRHARLMERLKRKVDNTQILESSEEKSIVDIESLEGAANLLHFRQNSVVFHKTYNDKDVQVNTYEDFKNYNVSHLLDNDYKCNVLTGVANLAILAILVEAVANLSNVRTKLDAKSKVVLTFMKLKLNLSFNSLGVIFQVDSKAARSYFSNTISHLSIILKALIRFPPKEEILNNMPRCFHNYRSTRVILDCTEIVIEKSVSPSGMITFLSKGYGGRVSDKAIFNSERVITKLDPGDSIMVDKGILIENECRQNYVKLIRPPFLRKNVQQFSKEDAIATASIARARVHVERSIQRLKIFKVCKGPVLWTLLPYMDEIMVVIAGMTNLSAPILASDKF